MSATQCLDSDFDAILIDDVCSFLSPRLVAMLRDQGKTVIGVYEATDAPDAKRRLLECGIADVIDSNAAAEEFLDSASTAVGDPTEGRRADRAQPGRVARSVGVMGVTDGSGATELAVTLAATAARSSGTVLVDLDPAWPSVAQRLDIPPHPNLRTLVDVSLHDGEVDSALHRLGPLGVATGSPWQRGINPIPHYEVTMALEVLTERYEVLVADLGAEERVPDIIVGGFDVVLLVASGDPVGLARLQKVRDRVVHILDRTEVVVVVNKVPVRRFYRAELKAEADSLMPGFPVVLLPHDPNLAGEAWEGRVAHRGPFAKEVDRIAGLVGRGAQR
jgi:MinD-like ATPase involved in chromosome partitioning or flagellar assembly